MFEFSQALRALWATEKVMSRSRKAAIRQLKRIENCVVRYEKAMPENDQLKLLIISAEYDELTSAFQRRLFQIIDGERSERLNKKMKEVFDLERRPGPPRERTVLPLNLGEYTLYNPLDPGTDHARTSRRDLEISLAELVGSLRGLRKSIE